MSNPKPIALITGVGRGLGSVMAQGLAESGYVVLGCSHSASSCEQATKTLGPPHIIRQVDVADAKAVQAWADEMLKQHAPPDLLINNAAVINRNAVLWEVPTEDFQRTMRVNVEGTYNVIAAFLPAMIAAKKGVIVNFSSGWGRSTSPEVAPYCATKWGVEGLTSALSYELPKGLAAVALNPGIIDTDMLRSCFGGNAAQYDDAEAWSRRAVPFLLNLTARENGKSLDIP